MPYYKTVEDLLKGIGKTSTTSIKRDISRSRNDNIETVKQIANGTYDYNAVVPQVTVPTTTTDLWAQKVYPTPYETQKPLTTADAYRAASVENRMNDKGIQDFNPKPVNKRGVGAALVGSFALGAVNTARQAALFVETGVDRSLQNYSDYFKAAVGTGPSFEQLKNKPVEQGGGTLWEQYKYDMTEGRDTKAKYLKSAEDQLTTYADVENETGITKFFAGVTQSIPVSVATRIPVLGWVLFGSSSFGNSIEESRKEAIAKNQVPNDNMILLRALGDAAVQVGSEMIFGLYKPLKSAVSKTSVWNATKGFLDPIIDKVLKNTGKSAIGSVIKQVGLTSTEEGLEEIIGAIGSGYVAKWTTMPEKTPEEIWAFKPLALAFLSGAVAAAGITGVRYAFTNTKAAIQNNQDLDINVPVPVEIQQAILTDMQDPANQDYVTKTIDKALTSYGEMPAEQVQQIKDRISPVNVDIPIVQRPTVPLEAPTATPKRRARAEQVQAVAPTVDVAHVADVVANAPKAVQTISTKKSPNNYQDLIPTLMSASNLVASNDVSGNETPEYNKAYQPRNRDRKASTLQMQNIVSKTDLTELTRTGDVASGISSFNPADLNVLSGNGRIAAIKQIYKAGGEPAARLRRSMLDLAQSLGIDTTNAPADPVISGALPAGVDAVRFAQESNPKPGLEYSNTENAKGDATRLTPKILLILKDADLNNVGNTPFVQDFLSSFTNEERAAFQQENGSLSQQGIARIENAIIYAAFPSDKLMNLISESTDSHVKNVTNALKNVSALVVKTKESIRKGFSYGLDISKDITSAVEKYIEISKMPKAAGYESAIDAYFAQVGMDVVEMSIMEEKLIKIFYAYKKQRTAIEGFFTDYYNGIESLGNPNEMSLFGGSQTVNKEEYIDRAFIKELGEKGKIYERANGSKENPNQLPLDFDMGTAQEVRQNGSESVPVETQPRVENKEAKANIATKENVNSIPLYHGTTRTFDKLREGSAVGWGKGIYLTPNISDTDEFNTGGKVSRVVDVRVNLTTPYVSGQTKIPFSTIKTTNAFNEFTSEYTKQRSKYLELEDIGVPTESDWYEFMSEDAKYLNAALRELGYDGIIAKDSNNYASEVVVFDSKSIVSENDYSAPTKVKAQAAEATKPAQLTVKMSDIEDMYKQKQPTAFLESAVDEWVNTKEGQKLVGNIKSREQLAEAVYNVKSQIGLDPMTTGAMMKIDLQLLALDRWGSRLEDVPEGSAITEHMRKMMSVLREAQPASVRNEINSEVTDEMIFHDVLADKKVIDKAHALMEVGNESERSEHRKEVVQALTILEDNLDPSIVIQADLYVKELFDQGNTTDAVAISDLISQRLTTVARFLRAAGLSADYFGTRRAKATIDGFNNDIDPVASDKLNIVSKETVKILVGPRNQAMDNATKDLDNAVSEMTPEEQSEEKRIASLAASMARKVAAYAESENKPTKEPTPEQLLLRRLMAKFTEKNPHLKDSIKTDPFAVLFEIVTNRGDYAEVWENAQDILSKAVEKSPTVPYDDVLTFIDQMLSPTHPVSAERFINSAIRQAIKDSGKTLNDYAKEYFFKGDTSLKGFYDYIISQVGTLDERSVSYLEKIIKPVFQQRLEEHRANIRTRLQEQIKRRSGIKIVNKTSMEKMLDKMMDVAYRDELNIPELKERWAERLGLTFMTPDMVADVYDTMKQIANMKSEEDQADAFFDLNSRLAQKVPASMVDKYLAWTRFSMLMNPPTLIRNMLSNIGTMPLYKTATRVQLFYEKMLGIRPDDRSSGAKYISKVDDSTFLGRTVLEHTGRKQLERFLSLSSKYDIKTVIGMEKRYFKRQWLNDLVRAPYRIMNEGQLGKIRLSALGDMYAFQIYFRSEMANVLNAKGYNENMPETQKQTLITDTMKQASEIATIRTFRQKTAFSEKLLSLAKPIYSHAQLRNATPTRRKQMKVTNAIVTVTAKIAIPFVLTPAALVYETVKFSPYAGIVSLLQLTGAKISSNKSKIPIPVETKMNIARALSQSTVGTVVPVLVGAILGALGYIDTEPPEPEKDKIAWELEGRRKYSIFIPGMGSFSIDWFQPVGTALLMGAAISKGWKNGEMLGSKFTGAMMGSANTLVKAGMVGSIMSLFGGAKYGQTEAEQIASLYKDSLFMGMPTMIARFNRVVDPYVRDIYSGSDAENFKNRFLSYVPVASFSTPLKIDIWGNPVKSSKYDGVGGLADRTFLNMLSPFLVNDTYKDEVTKEVMRVYKEAGTDALPNFQDKNFDGYTLTGKDYEWIVKDGGQRMYKGVQTLMQNSAYRGLTPAKQAAVLAKMYTAKRKESREAFVKQFNPKK